VAAPFDYYKTLGVQKAATDAEIKTAYRRLARQLHPDVTGDDPKSTEKFKQITEAYEVLSDSRRRRTYDLFGAPSASGGAPGGPPVDTPFSDIADAVADVWRRTQRRTGPEPGTDIERLVMITLAEAATGCEKVIELDVMRGCVACEGKGHPKDKPPETCPDCAGAGTKGGTFPLKRTCSRCDGAGVVRRYTCKACAGEGARREKETLKVTVPAGVDNGTRLRMKGRGVAGRNGGAPGDLYAVVDVSPDSRFERDGADLKTTLRVGIKDALLGGRAEVALPHGTAVMTIPAGTQGGQIFRIRGKGMPRLTTATGAGDVLVTVQVRIPTGLSTDARTQLQTMLQKLEQVVPEL